ncbi:MAG: choice-of-anchor D domain-containing protein, partial [Verrucomicrobiaceae bacterium]
PHDGGKTESRDYGTVETGTSTGSLTFVLKNTGIRAATCTAGLSVSDAVRFTVSTGCTAVTSLSPGASCTVTVSALPATVATYPLTLTKTCERVGAVSATASVSGLAATTALSWNSSSLDFLRVTQTVSSAPQEFYFRNSDASTVACSAPVITGAQASEFTLNDIDCSTTSLVGRSFCSVQVSASPSSSGLKTATLSRTCAGSTQTLTLTRQDGGTARPTALSQSIGGASELELGHACIVTSGGEAKCWGKNDHGQLGNDSNVATKNRFVFVRDNTNSANLLNVIQVSVGHSSTCAVTSSGNLYCWGYAVNGQLGNGSLSDRYYPDVVQTAASTPLTSVDEVSVGSNSACARVGGTGRWTRTCRC